MSGKRPHLNFGFCGTELPQREPQVALAT
jgi:hypothetical protein